MVFGKIDYLNLLPFYVFLKRYLKGSSAKLSLNKKSAYPSLVNQWFAAKRIDFAVISSIESFKCPSYKKLDFGNNFNFKNQVDVPVKIEHFRTVKQKTLHLI